MKKTIRVPFNERQPGDRFETRSGLPCRVLCDDFLGEKPVIAAVTVRAGVENEIRYRLDGYYNEHVRRANDLDLFAVREIDAPEFDLDAAKAGAPVMTKSGFPARIVCFDRMNNDYPLAVLVNEGGREYTYHHTLDGKFSVGMDSDEDLVMA